MAFLVPLMARAARPAAHRGRTAAVAVRDAAATRERILRAAETEFSAKGLAGARVDVIARASGSNKRMIYYYFASKEQLYVSVLEQAYADLRRRERDIVLGHLEPKAAIRALVQFKFDYFDRHP